VSIKLQARAYIPCNTQTQTQAHTASIVTTVMSKVKPAAVSEIIASTLDKWFLTFT